MADGTDRLGQVWYRIPPWCSAGRGEKTPSHHQIGWTSPGGLVSSRESPRVVSSRADRTVDMPGQIGAMYGSAFLWRWNENNPASDEVGGQKAKVNRTPVTQQTTAVGRR